MGQEVYDVIGGTVLELRLPGPDAPLLHNIQWGNAGDLFCPAFWKARLWYACNRDQNAYLDYSSRKALHHEVAACLLGGHGITSEMALAAFKRLHDEGLLERHVPRRETRLRVALQAPLTIEAGRKPVRYRFPAIKAAYLAEALERLGAELPPNGTLEFRAWLRSFKGIGWKTASWITRNWKHSNEVAVIDVHVFRACSIIGLFGGDPEKIPQQYPELECRFLSFANALHEEARRLDVLIWRTMKDSQWLGVDVFKRSRESALNAA